MARQRHLKNAPIREAVIAFHFEPALSLKVVEDFASAIKSDFDQSQRVWQQSMGFELTEDGTHTATSASRAAAGVRLESTTRKHVVILRTTGFTFCRLAPYQDWDEVVGAAEPLWAKFIEQCKPELVTRINVRYINALELPMPVDEFRTYLTAPPTVPEGLPQGLAAFVQRVAIVDPDSKRSAFVTQALEEAQPELKSITIFLDIDTYSDVRVEPGDKEILDVLSGLHDFKNDLFFGHIEEKTAELYE